MPSQVHQESHHAERREEEVSEDSITRVGQTAVGASRKDNPELDKLMEEIDDLLETNAQEFVESYIQKGGE
jgi:ubiquitin-like protein Pup